MFRKFVIGLFVLGVASGTAEYAIIGGQDAASAYSATVTFSAIATPVSGGPLPSSGMINSVAMNRSGFSIIGGQEGGINTFAALVSPSGFATLLSPPPTGTIMSVAINQSGSGIIGGEDYSGTAPAYAALVSASGTLTSLSGAPLPTTGVIQSVAINDGGFALIGGQDLNGGAPAFAAYVSPSGVASLLTGDVPPPISGIIQSVDINTSGKGIIGGENYSTGGAYAVFVDSSHVATLLSPLPTMGIINSVSINDSGVAIIGGRDFSGTLPAYAALVTSSGIVNPILDASLPTTGSINSVAINESGSGIIGGQDLATSTPYAALISPSGGAIPLAPFSATGAINSVAINDSGAAIIGGINDSIPYAALVSPSGILTIISPLPTSGTILSVALSEVTPASIGPYTSVINNLLTASFALNSHIMIHHKKLRLKERMNEEMALVVDANFEEQSLCMDVCEEELPTFTLWVEPFYDTIYQKKQKVIPAFSNQIAGMIAALDYRPSDEIVLGGGLAYAFNYVHYSKSLGHAKINQEMAVLYSSFDTDWVFINAAIWGGLYQLDNTRRSIASITSKGKTDGWVLSPHLEMSVPYHTSCWLTIEPFAMFDWVNSWQKHFTEKGVSGFNLEIKNRYASLLRSELGLRFYEVLQYCWGQFIMEQKASYINQAPFHFNPISTAFVGSASSFSIATGSSTVQNLGGAQLHFSLIPTEIKYPYASLDFQGEFGSSFQSYFVGLEIGQRF